MRWTSRLRRYGGLAAITARREEQARLLVKAIESRQRVGTIPTRANDVLQWLSGNELRCLNDAEVAEWKRRA
jgi:hypothetical protein